MQQRKVGKYPFSIDVEGAKPIEAVLVVGKTEGKTLVVTAGVHGDEYVAIQAVRELLNELQPQKLRGQSILVPIINNEGFYDGTYLGPEDGENLNRCFPGSKKKSVTWRMAHALERSLYPKADFLLDLHGGSPYETMTPLVFFPVGAGKKVQELTRNAAQKLSLSYMVQSYAKDGLYSWAAQCGVPAVLIERGGGGTGSRVETEACKENIYQIMSFLDIIPYNKQRQIPVEIQDAHYETAVSRGYWYYAKTSGTSFRTGELLGRLEGEDGCVQQEIYAPYNGVILYHTHSLGVTEGMPLMAYGKVCSKHPAEE